jgi:amidase
VRDSAALLDATAGPDVGDPYCAPPQTRPFLDEVGADPGRLRIAFTTEAPTGVPVHEDCAAAVRDAAALCADLGHEVVEGAPELDGPAMAQAFMCSFAAGNAAMIDGLAQITGRTPTQDVFEPFTWTLYEMGREVSASIYLQAVHTFQTTGRQLARFLLDYDVWLTPTVAEPPLPLGSFEASIENPWPALLRVGTFMPFTPICNVTGHPAMSVPLYWNGDGLPIGAHFVGRFGDEATLCRLAAQLEEARPWAGRRPTVAA